MDYLAALQIENLQQENSSLKKQAQKLKEQFHQQKVGRTAPSPPFTESEGNFFSALG